MDAVRALTAEARRELERIQSLQDAANDEAGRRLLAVRARGHATRWDCDRVFQHTSGGELWVGSESCIDTRAGLNTLYDLGVRTIVNCTRQVPLHGDGRFTVIRLPVEQIIGSWPRLRDSAIDRIADGGRVMVHCRAGFEPKHQSAATSQSFAVRSAIRVKTKYSVLTLITSSPQNSDLERRRASCWHSGCLHCVGVSPTAEHRRCRRVRSQAAAVHLRDGQQFGVLA